MDRELSEHLRDLRDAITEAMWNSEAVLNAMGVLRQSGSDVQVEINVVPVADEPSLAVGPAAAVANAGPAAKLILDPADSLFLRTLNISDL
jgi:hypothetical protein